MRNAILAGVPSTSMPAFRSALDDKDVDAIIAYLKRAFMHGQKGHFQPNRR
jgi:mono/diheme cytochrome c family protein